MGIFTVTGGFVIMVICIVTSIILALTGGIVIDNVYGGVYDAGMYDDLPETWNNGDSMFGMMNLYYLCCVGIALVGVVAFVLSILRKEPVDSVYQY